MLLRVTGGATFIRLTALVITATSIACSGAGVEDSYTADSPDADLAKFGDIDENAGGGDGITIGGAVNVTADSLNLRDAVGTSGMILATMPCGTELPVSDGPSITPLAGWWQVTYDGKTGWASGKYLAPVAQFNPLACGTNAGGTPAVSEMLARAELGVGYSYYWGHGSWRSDNAQRGTCVGSCPGCTHTGQYGADCSGYVAKIWQVPSPSALEIDQHPYSTSNFYNEETYWHAVPRNEMQPGDAFVRRVDGGGHMGVLHEATDPFGALWVYEARACATGVVHNLRTIDSSYKFIRRNGL